VKCGVEWLSAQTIRNTKRGRNHTCDTTFMPLQSFAKTVEISPQMNGIGSKA
jgi:hypothetical protein